MYKDILIGKHVKIVQSFDKSLISKSGKIIDESKNLLKFKSDGNSKILSIPKRICTIEVEGQRGILTIDGRDLQGTAIERIHRI